MKVHKRSSMYIIFNKKTTQNIETYTQNMKTQWEHNVIMWKQLKIIKTLASREIRHSCLNMSSGDFLVSIWRSMDLYATFCAEFTAEVFRKSFASACLYTCLSNIWTSSQYVHLKFCYKHLVRFLMTVYIFQTLFTCLWKKTLYSERPNNRKPHICDGLVYLSVDVPFYPTALYLSHVHLPFSMQPPSSASVMTPASYCMHPPCSGCVIQEQESQTAHRLKTASSQRTSL